MLFEVSDLNMYIDFFPHVGLNFKEINNKLITRFTKDLDYGITISNVIDNTCDWKTKYYCIL